MSIFNKKPVQLFLSALSVIILGLAVEHIYRTYGPTEVIPVYDDLTDDKGGRIEFDSKIPQVENQMLKEIEIMVKSIESNSSDSSNSIPLCASLSKSMSKVTKCRGKYSDELFKYVGEILNNLADGQGMMTYKSGLTNIGEFKKGIEDGKVISKDAQGNVIYIGERKDGLRHGKGSMYIPHSFPRQSYIGQFSEDEINGYGKYDYGDRVYEGTFFRGLRHGQGTEVYKDGSTKYSGSWVYGNREGSGKLYNMGDIYEGSFKDHVEDGYGVYTFRNGDKIMGNYKNGERQGQSTYYYQSGHQEECDNYYHGLANGNCIYRWPGGDYTKSFYVKGVLNGPQTQRLAASITTSFFKDNLLHGERIETYTNGDIRKSYYKMGMKHGPETYMFSNGERHEMNYVDNKMDGVTRIYYVSGNIQECKYDMGKPLGCEFTEIKE